MKTKVHNQKLISYSALSAAFLAAGDAVQAQVIYTDVDPDFIYTEETATPPEFAYVNIDFDGNSLNEMLVGFGSLKFSGTCYTSGYMSFYAINYLGASIAVVTNTTGMIHPKVFNEGELIDAGANWNNYILRSFVRTDFYIDNCDTDIEYPNLQGNWNGSNQKYFGARFLIGSSYHYGWVRMTVELTVDSGDAELNEIQVYGYAYEQTANTGINAGTGYVPNALTDIHTFLQIFPNPAADYIYLQLQNQNESGLRYTLLNLQGEIQSGGFLPDQNAGISIHHLPAGLYIIQLYNQDDHLLGTNRFVKQ